MKTTTTADKKGRLVGQRASPGAGQRSAILARAAALFAERGYAATSMNDVAAASSLSKATLYHYFADKSELLFEIADGHVSRLVEIVGDAEREPVDAEQRLRGLIARFMEEYEHAHHAHRVLTEDVKFLDARAQRRVLDKERQVVGAFARAIVAVRPQTDAAGLAKPLTMLLFGMLNWMFTWLRPDGALSYRQMTGVVSDLFFSGLTGLPIEVPVAAPARKPAPEPPVKRRAPRERPAP